MRTTPHTPFSERVGAVLPPVELTPEQIAAIAAQVGGVSLGETQTTAYRGDRGKAAYDAKHSNSNDHASGSDNQDLSNLVVKVTNKSLVLDTEISKIHSNTLDHSNSNDHASGSDNQDLSGLEPKQTGKSLSTNDYTTAEQTKLSGIATSAEVNVNADWNAVTGDAQILNKPSIPAAQVQTDWNAVAGMGVLLNKPTISGSNTGDETAARIATIVTGAGAQTAPLDADEFPFYKIVGTILSKVTWANIKATLKVVEDLLYNPKRLFTNLAAPVVSSGTTEKILIQLAIPAARAVVGSTFRAWLIGNSSSTGTLIFKVREGAGGVITDAVAWTAITSAAQAANKRAGFDVLITVRSATTNYTDGIAYAGSLQLETVIAVPATSAIVISGIWYISLTVICSSGTFTCQVGSIEELR